MSIMNHQRYPEMLHKNTSFLNNFSTWAHWPQLNASVEFWRLKRCANANCISYNWCGTSNKIKVKKVVKTWSKHVSWARNLHPTASCSGPLDSQSSVRIHPPHPSESGVKSHCISNICLTYKEWSKSGTVGLKCPSPQTPPWLRLVDQSGTHSLSSQEHSYQVNMQWQNAPNASKCCTSASQPSLVFVKSSSWSVKRRKTNGSSQQFLVRAIWAWPSPPGYQRALLLFHEPWFRQLIFDEESLLHRIVRIL